jgi:hypothetical protein
MQTAAVCFGVRIIEETDYCISDRDKCFVIFVFVESQGHTDHLDQVRDNDYHSNRKTQLQLAAFIHYLNQAMSDEALVRRPFKSIPGYLRLIINVAYCRRTIGTHPAIGRVQAWAAHEWEADIWILEPRGG